MNNHMPIALVTGGSRGLGRSTVEALARRGVNVVFTYKANHAEADKVVEQVKLLGATVIPLQLSMGETATFDAFIEKFKVALRELGPINFIIWSITQVTPAGWGFLTLLRQNLMRCTTSM